MRGRSDNRIHREARTEMSEVGVIVIEGMTTEEGPPSNINDNHFKITRETKTRGREGSRREIITAKKAILISLRDSKTTETVAHKREL